MHRFKRREQVERGQAVGRGEGRAAYLALAMMMLCMAFYFPLTSKAVNNFFYIAVALPCLLWAISRPLALWGLLQSFAWLFGPLLLLVLLNAGELADLKKWLYLFLLFMACVFMEGSSRRGGGFFALFALISCCVFLLILVDWYLIWERSDRLVRYRAFFGELINPVYFSLLIGSSLIFLWLFRVEPWLERSGARHIRLLGLFVLLALELLCSVVFQSRSPLLGVALFLAGYALHRRLALQSLCALVVCACVAFASGAADMLISRGLSYRLDIWYDAWLRLMSVCGVWWGCGADDYRFLGQYHHAHSAYVAVLYRSGVVGAVVFGAIAASLFWRCGLARSRWLLVALFGWGSILTTTGGVLTSPQPLWVYLWLPTFMAVLESQRDSLDLFFARHVQIKLRPDSA